MLPAFIIGGIQKSGTTYLDSLLRNHPEIWLPQRSTRYSFFDNEEIYRQGAGWYESLFTPPEAGMIVGQTSADCAFDPEAPRRIKDLIPEARLIFLVRHPISRAYSNYWHQVKMGREYLSFEQAIEMEAERVKDDLFSLKKYSYVGRSRYKTQFDNLFQFFCKEDVLIIPFEVFVKDELTFVNSIFEFIGASPIDSVAALAGDNVRKNPSEIPAIMAISRLSYILGKTKMGRYLYSKTLVKKKPKKMKEETRSMLEERLKEDMDFYYSIVTRFEPASNF